jgi:hypothetical protein
LTITKTQIDELVALASRSLEETAAELLKK